MNLYLALFWLLLGAALIGYEMTTGDTRFYIRGTHLSFSWVPLLLAAYNLMRWWGIRSYQAEQRALRIAEASRERQRLMRERREPLGNPDPNFNFTDEPPAAPNRNITDQPPSNN